MCGFYNVCVWCVCGGFIMCVCVCMCGFYNVCVCVVFIMRVSVFVGFIMCVSFIMCVCVCVCAGFTM